MPPEPDLFAKICMFATMLLALAWLLGYVVLPYFIPGWGM